jgi:ABC-2 type transport system permease protein
VRNLSEPVIVPRREGALAQAASELTIPYPLTQRSLAWHLAQLLRVIRVEMREYRSTWFYHALFGCLMPLGLIFLLSRMGGEITPERAVFLIGGNLVTSIIYGPTINMAGKIGWGREHRTFEYWAGLPIPKLTWLLGILTVYLLLALPSILTIFFLGAWTLSLPLTRGIALIPLIPLGALSLVGLGAFLGVIAPNGQAANMLGNALTGIVTFLSPTMLPLEAMPGPLRLIARLMPTTYAAEAFRSALSGRFDLVFAYDVGILAVLAVLFLTVLARRLDFRG